MLKEALQYLVGLGEAHLKWVNEAPYSDKPLHRITLPTVEPLEVHTLTGLVDYLKSNFDDYDSVMIQVLNPTEVKVVSGLNNDQKRSVFIRATAQVPQIPFDTWRDPESFVITLQANFVVNDDLRTLLKVVGNIKEEQVTNYGDDGVSQAVTAKTGVATVEKVKVPNPVLLKPYRTFVEVTQPESEFVFRMRSGPVCGLFEADGGAWKIQAIHAIRDYLKEQLSVEIKNGKVTIIA